MSDDGIVKNMVATISFLTRDNIDCGSLSLRIWKIRHDLNVSQCIWLAKKLLAHKRLEEITEFDIKEN